ncbi:phasin family protein [Pseudoponticoccus marisrubri]|uniref:Phasin domain-containing protein n=1 Tax=Pseudoponticoccus marisrubri TaxID=1685382 RepID=A0A0W7WDC7_9RHOB|nr:phasin family protein [Pseudoponticoccus marisrubri]KUF08620.1 hypothetical protein AVJ23_21890 [Pseudoponticoccus marisrubri]
MAKQNTKSAATDMQNLFDPQGYQDVFKTWAQIGERMTTIATEAAARSTDIASESTKEAFSNFREMNEVRDQPADYAKAYSDFAQKQMDLFTRAAKAMTDVSQKAGTEATEMATKVGEDMSETVAANAQGTVDKVTSAANKAA